MLAIAGVVLPVERLLEENPAINKVGVAQLYLLSICGYCLSVCLCVAGPLCWCPAADGGCVRRNTLQYTPPPCPSSGMQCSAIAAEHAQPGMSCPVPHPPLPAPGHTPPLPPHATPNHSHPLLGFPCRLVTPTRTVWCCTIRLSILLILVHHGLLP